MSDQKPISKLFIFDVDDTLFDTFTNGFSKFVRVSEMLGVEKPNLSDFASLYGLLPYEDCIEKLFPTSDALEVDRLYKFLTTEMPDILFEDVRSTFASLSKLGIEIGILTNGPRTKTMRKLSRIGFESDFYAFIITSDEMEERKPSHKAFSGIQLHRACNLKNIIYFGDSYIDHLASTHAGLSFIGVVRHQTSVDGGKSLNYFIENSIPFIRSVSETLVFA